MDEDCQSAPGDQKLIQLGHETLMVPDANIGQNALQQVKAR